MTLCPLCRKRPARRSCPAKQALICPVCCGTKRLIEIDCPRDCVYLKTAERHPPAVTVKQDRHDISTLNETVAGLSAPQLEVLFMLHGLIAEFRSPVGLGSLLDADVAEAVAVQAGNHETAANGVIYDRTSTNPMAEGLRRAIDAFTVETRERGGTRAERELAEVLRAIERGARHEAAGLDGDRGYLELMARLLRDSPFRRASPPAHAGSTLILP